jgi:PIN domain nuclease of toxin-antitoxin system
MRFLLDTHTAFWYFEDNPALSQKAKEIICDGVNEIFVSVVSVWEIAIKRSLGIDNTTLRNVNESLDRIVASGFERQGVEQIPTIHLGVAVIQMERKGIATDRGDINREIIMTNSQMKQIRARIAKAV